MLASQGSMTASAPRVPIASSDRWIAHEPAAELCENISEAKDSAELLIDAGVGDDCLAENHIWVSVGEKAGSTHAVAPDVKQGTAPTIWIEAHVVASL